jgi:hypothetical protein
MLGELYLERLTAVSSSMDMAYLSSLPLFILGYRRLSVKFSCLLSISLLYLLVLRQMNLLRNYESFILKRENMNKRPSIEEDSKGPGGVTASKREFLYR